MTLIQVLPVFRGDSLLLTFDKNLTVLIDTGPKKSYTKGVLRKVFQNLKKIDLLILTHTDEDHIGGILKYYGDNNRPIGLIDKVWFNTGSIICKELNLLEKKPNQVVIYEEEDIKVSVNNGLTLEKLLLEEGIIANFLIKAGDKYRLGPIDLFILSPEVDDLKKFYGDWDFEQQESLMVSASSDYKESIDNLLKRKFKEKGSLANRTSIALLIKTSNASLLLMGDAFSSVIEKRIRSLGYHESNKLVIDIVKVSHHASASGISPSLLDIIDCRKFIISSDGSNELPTKECLARIVAHRSDRITLFFNYKNAITENIFFDKETETYNFQIQYLDKDGDYGIQIE